MFVESLRPFAPVLLAFASIVTNLSACAVDDTEEESEEDLDANLEDDEDASTEIFGAVTATDGQEPRWCKPGWTFYSTEAADWDYTDGLTGACHADCKSGYVPWDEWTCVSCEAPSVGVGGMPYCADAVQKTYHRGAPRPATCAPDEILQTKTVWSATAPPKAIPLCYKRL